MAFEFFLSYTRSNYDEYLKVFFDDLSKEVGVRRDRSEDPVGFFDEIRIKSGDEWNRQLEDALQSSKTMICLYSDAYFQSDSCGKEWHVFHKRRELYVKRQGGAVQQNVSLPSSIKPIRWLPFKTTLSDPVSLVHYDYGAHDGVYNIQGLRSIVKLKDSLHKDLYVKFVEDLAERILASGRETPLPPLDVSPSWDGTESIFRLRSDSSTAGKAFLPPANQRKGPRNVLFVFVAAKPQELKGRSPEPYLMEGGPDWKPFFPPNDLPIAGVALEVAADQELRLFSDELAFSENLVKDIKSAKDDSKIVVLLVDRWTATLPDYQRILQEFDNEFLYNCGVVVPSNENNGDSLQERAELERIIKETFNTRTTLIKNPIFFRDDIRSEAQLRAALREILLGIKAVIRDRAPLKRPTCEVSKPLPEVQNQINIRSLV